MLDLLASTGVVDTALGGIFVPPAGRFVVELPADPSWEGALDGGAEAAGSDSVDSVRRGVGWRTLAALVRRLLKLLLRPTTSVTAPELSSSSSPSSDTHWSHSSHPTKVPKLLQLASETDETRSWKMHAKLTTNMMTEQTCCRMMVESATRGQKSYGFRRGLSCRLSRKVAWSV
jgi:hypothetical protein